MLFKRQGTAGQGKPGRHPGGRASKGVSNLLIIIAINNNDNSY